MSQGFLIWTDFHPILVGAGCLALGYVYGRHCRSSSEIQAGIPLSEDACCAQSQSNTYLEELERCKCCMSAPADLDIMGVGNGKGNNYTRSPYLVQDAVEGYEQSERSAKRDHKQLNTIDSYAHHMEELDYTDDEAQGLHLRSGSPYFEKSFQIPEEEQLLQAKMPFKKQKGTPGIKEPLSSKGKAEMGSVNALGSEPMGDDQANDSAGSVPWSQEILNKRIDYFNNVISVSESPTESGRTDESRKIRHFKKNFLKVDCGGKGDVTESSNSMNSQKSNQSVRSASICGLVPLAKPDRVDCSLDNSPNSPYRMSGSGCDVAIAGEPSVDSEAVQNLNNTEASEALEMPCFVENIHSSNIIDDNLKDCDRDADASRPSACVSNERKLENDLEFATGRAASLSVADCQLVHSIHEMLQTPSASQTPEHSGPDRCSGRSELRKEVPANKVLKAEIYELLNEADCSTKISFQEIVSLLEKRLQTNLQENKAHIATLVREVISISRLLEKEAALDEVESEQLKP